MFRPVVVGLDGSPESLAAADWAAGEALRRGLPVHFVHAWEGLSPTTTALPELDAPRNWSRRILRGAMEYAGERHPQVDFSAEQLARPAAEALVAVGSEAELLVLGSHSPSGIGGFLTGSVALATVARATRPVVLVRADGTDGSEPDGEGRSSAYSPYRDVVVGLDTAHPCEGLVAFAFEAAALRSAPLRVVHVCHPPYAHGHAPGSSDKRSRMGAEQNLASMLRPWRRKYPTVDVREHVEVENGSTARLLLHASAGASLLAVGRRVRSARLGPHTGPVTHAMMHHARCPVAIVPHE